MSLRPSFRAAALAAALLACAAAATACDERPVIEAPPAATSRPPRGDAAAGEEAEREAGQARPPAAVARVDEPAAPAGIEDSASAHGRVRPVRRKGQEKPKEGSDVAPPSPEDRWLQCEQYDVDFRGKTLRTLRIGKPGWPEVLLLHGARFNCRNWLELGTLELLAKNGFRAVAIDLPGYGKSKEIPPKPEEFLFHALPFLDLKKPVVVFPSMSGSFAFPLAIEHPELVAGLVPVAPVAIDDYAAKLKGIEIPTLIVWGEKDDVIPISKAETLQKLLPKSQKIVIAGAGHPCYLDQPQQFHAALLRFLKSLEPPPK